MEFTLHKNFSEINPTEWNTLLSESISNVPFLRHEYLNAWWSTCGGGEWPEANLVLVSAREDDQIIGIAPLFLTEQRPRSETERDDGKQALMLLGSIEISDYLDLIVRANDLSRFLSGLLDFLARPTVGRGRPTQPQPGQRSTGITCPRTHPRWPHWRPKLKISAGPSHSSPSARHCPCRCLVTLKNT